MPADSTITKTVWQYSEPLPKETMEFLWGIARDYSKIKNYTYKRYSGIKSLDRLTPVFDIMSEVRHSGIRTQLGLPSAYFDPAIIDAVADIKGMWGMLKNKLGTLITANQNLSDEDRIYLWTVMRLDKIYAAVLRHEKYEMPKKVRGILVCPYRAAVDRWRIYEKIRKRFEERHFIVRCIQHSEISQYIDSDNIILFVDQNELYACGMRTKLLFGDKYKGLHFRLYIDVFHKELNFSGEECAMYLRKLLNKGIRIIGLTFDESTYWKQLTKKLKCVLPMLEK